MPTLGQEVLAGASGLDRVVLWAHSCEMPDPWRWLGPDELLMTVGLSLPESDLDQVEFVRRLDSAQLSGMTIGDDQMAPPISPSMLAEADRLGFPVLSTRHNVPFVVLGRTVSMANEAGQTQHLLLISRLYRALNNVPASPAEAIVDMESTFGIRMAVADVDTGTLIFSGSLKPTPEAVREVCRQARTRVEPYPRGVLMATAGHLKAWDLAAARNAVLLVEEADSPLLDSFTLAHLQQAVTTAVNNFIATSMLNVARGEHLVSSVLARQMPIDTLVGQCRELGLVGPEMVVFAAATDRSDDLLMVLSTSGIPHLPRRFPDRLICCVNRDQAQATLDAVAPLAQGVGVSPPFAALHDLDEAIRKSAWALTAAPSPGGAFVRYEQVRASVLPRDSAAAREIVQAVLGPLLEPDERKERLLQTLRCYLAHDRSWAATADKLGIHRQSLAYRLQQIEAATGKSLKQSRDLAELWIAVTSHEIFIEELSKRTHRPL
jgi:PucR family transcriptional regulator, purine catabolism regulatory protein